MSDSLFIRVDKAVDLMSADSNGLSDPYIVVLRGAPGSRGISKVHKTKVIKKSLNPVWTGEECTIRPASVHDVVTFNVFDKDLFKDDPLGWCSVAVSDLRPFNQPKSVALALKQADKGELFVTLCFNEAVPSPQPPLVSVPAPSASAPSGTALAAYPVPISAAAPAMRSC